MAFERFIKTKNRGIPSISIWGRGQISFNRSSIVEFDIKKYAYVVLFYDNDTGRIGIKLSNEAEEGSCRILKYGDTCAVTVTSFLRYYKISSVKKRPITIDKENGMLVA